MVLFRVMAVAAALASAIVLVLPAQACDSPYPWLCEPAPSIDLRAETTEPDQRAAKPLPLTVRRVRTVQDLAQGERPARTHKRSARKSAQRDRAARARPAKVVATAGAAGAAAPPAATTADPPDVASASPRDIGPGPAVPPAPVSAGASASTSFAALWEERSMAEPMVAVVTAADPAVGASPVRRPTPSPRRARRTRPISPGPSRQPATRGGCAACSSPWAVSSRSARRCGCSYNEQPMTVVASAALRRRARHCVGHTVVGHCPPTIRAFSGKPFQGRKSMVASCITTPKIWVAGAVAGLVFAAAPAAAQAPPGFSPLDKSNPATSQQDTNLKPHPTPPIAAAPDKLPVDKLKLPAGFKAETWSTGHPGARTMVMGPKGTMFMGTRLIGRVYAITNKDGKREAKVLFQGLTQPNGLAFKDGALYVLAINKVLRYDNIEYKLDNPGEPVDLTDKFNLPPDIHHNWKYADFGPDGKLYIQVGANCNICEINNGVHGQIRRYNADGSGMEIVARGVRNTVGFDWHPVSKELWFTDNGRDWAGNTGPEDELNVIAKGKEGAFYGFPYCHANGIADPDIKIPNPCAGVTLPARF